MVYAVHPEIEKFVPQSLRKRMLLVLTITRQGRLHLWPIRSLHDPNANSAAKEWASSALDMALVAQEEWIQVIAAAQGTGYERVVALKKLPEPVWPDLSFVEIFKIAYRETFIDRADHPAILELTGAR